jgi:hypothetical protein
LRDDLIEAGAGDKHPPTVDAQVAGAAVNLLHQFGQQVQGMVARLLAAVLLNHLQ